MLEGATYWEIAALSKLLDTYMNDSEELGIDTNGYEEFMDHCYIRQPWLVEDDYERDLNGGISVHGYDRYTLSNTVTELMLYRQKVTEQTLINYGPGYGDSEINSEEDDKKVRYNCFISDSLMMICTYYDCIEVERERSGHLLSMSGKKGYEELDNVKIEVRNMKDHIGENEYEVQPITIYMLSNSVFTDFSDSLKQVFKASQKDEDEEMIIAGLKIMKDLAIDTAGDMAENLAVCAGANESLYGGGENAVKFGIDLFGLSQVREETIEYNQQIDELINAVDYQRFLNALSAGGTICQYGDDVLINNRMINERELLMRVNYYNAETGSDLKLEELEQQLRNYELSSGNTADLEDFCAFVEEEGAYMAEASGDYLNYYDEVAIALNEQGLNKLTATQEQLEEACKKVL